MKKRFLVFGLIFVVGGLLYFVNQSISIYGGDGGDLVAASLVFGIPHPPGYPLYTFLGFLLTKLPILTPAWRVGLLSSISSIITLYLFFLILNFLIKDVLVSFITTLTLATSYLFWLYSVVPEVFALNNLFLALLVYLFINWLRLKKVEYLFWWFFFFGLAFSHHQTISLILFASFYFIFQRRKNFKKRHFFLFLILFFAGLFPYLYLPTAASFSPPINYENPTNLQNFIRLVTRASYGTFKVGSFVGDTIIQRWLSLKFAFKLLFSDFRILGSLLIFLGLFYLFFKKEGKDRDVFLYLFFLLLTFLFFIFYASFPLSNDFLVGTFERFLLAPLMLMTIFLGIGIKFFADLLGKVFLKSRSFVKILPDPVITIKAIFFILPLGFIILNYPKISVIRNEQAPENLALDILNHVEKDSFILSHTDTALFSLLYVYHWQKKWPQVKLIHPSKLNYSYYQNYLKKNYPDIFIPPPDSKSFMRDFIDENAKKFPFYSKEPITGLTGRWLPYGLLLRYFPLEKPLPSVEEVIQKNEVLWKDYQYPLKGSLGFYKNLLLSDVLRIYATDRETYGLFLLENQRYKEAEEQFRIALSLSPSYLDTHLNLGKALLGQKKCQEAISEFQFVYNKDKDLIEAIELISKTYGECFFDKVKEKEFSELYHLKLKERQTLLEKL